MNYGANALICLHIPVSNLKKSTDFYVNQIGFTLVRSPQRGNEGDSNSLLRLGDSPTIFLHETTDVVNLQFRNVTNTFTHAIFEIHTEQIEDFYLKLKQDGVKVGERYDNPGCGKYFDFYDPDGHMMKVCQDWKIS